MYRRKNIQRFLITISLLGVPFVAGAQRFSDFRGVVDFLVSLFNEAVALLIGLGVVYVLYGIMKTILHSDNEKIRSDGRQVMLYGVIALFVIVSMWGLVNVLVGTFFGGSVPGLSQSGYTEASV